MKNKKILALIILIIGLILIVLALLLNKSASTKIYDLEFKNLQITATNSFTIDVYNPSDKKIENKKVLLYLLNEENKLIMVTEIDINNLNSYETKTIEYSQSDNFYQVPVDFYVKKYQENNNKENISLEAKLSNLLVEAAKEVINENYKKNDKDITLTALSLKNDYQKDLSEFLKKEYNCSLENSFVEVRFYDNNFKYTSYLECEIFKEK